MGTLLSCALKYILNMGAKMWIKAIIMIGHGRTLIEFNYGKDFRPRQQKVLLIGKQL